MSQNQLRKLSAALLSLEIKISEGMITVPIPNMKSHSFYALVETDQGGFKTDYKHGPNPKWKHIDSVTSTTGEITFSMFQKGRALG